MTSIHNYDIPSRHYEKSLQKTYRETLFLTRSIIIHNVLLLAEKNNLLKELWLY